MDQNASSAIERLRHGDEPTRLAAAQWLAQHPTSIATVVLVGALADDCEEVRTWAGEALENLGPPSADQLDDLLQYVRSESEDQAYWAATLIGRLGPHGRSAVTRLSELAANHPSANVRRRIQWALEAIGFS
jgi:hypothetical protein